MEKTWIEKIIETGNYNKEALMRKMAVFLLNDRITEAEYNELVEMMG